MYFVFGSVYVLRYSCIVHSSYPDMDGGIQL